VRKAGIKARETNNVVERLHGTLKDSLKPLRRLKSEKTAEIWLDGWFVHYNFWRSHLSLKGKTPVSRRDDIVRRFCSDFRTKTISKSQLPIVV